MVVDKSDLSHFFTRSLVRVIIVLGSLSMGYAETHIMMIGNSITEGVYSSDGLGFRDGLYDRLAALSYPFVFEFGKIVRRY